MEPIVNIASEGEEKWNIGLHLQDRLSAFGSDKSAKSYSTAAEPPAIPSH